MALEVRIRGPGLDVTRRLEPGAGALILGRDAECGVPLPDPERMVSRRHLSVRNEQGELHFHVLSVVNGITLPSGEVPPGARGVLAFGQPLRVGAYELTVQPVADGAEPDPFGDWGFHTTFGADMPAGGGLEAAGFALAQDIAAFYRGLGLDPGRVGALSEGELESMGRMVRMAVVCLLEQHGAVAASRRELHAQDRTMLAPRERNPLRESDWPTETQLNYLFAGRAATAAFMRPERALREIVTELAEHERATAAAARAVVAGVLREFEPQALKARLLGGTGRLFESARAWDAFVRDYEQQQQDQPAWVQRLLDRYFAEAYAQESMRGSRDSTGTRR